MRRFDSNAVLTAAALTGRSLAWFPLWVLMIVSFCGRGLSAGCLILTLLAVPAAFAARGIYRLRGKNTGMILRLMLYAVTAAGGSLLLHHVTGRWAVPIMLSVVTLGAAIIVAVVVYIVMVVVTKSVTLEDMKLIPKGEKIAKLLHIK